MQTGQPLPLQPKTKFFFFTVAVVPHLAPVTLHSATTVHVCHVTFFLPCFPIYILHYTLRLQTDVQLNKAMS